MSMPVNVDVDFKLDEEYIRESVEFRGSIDNPNHGLGSSIDLGSLQNQNSGNPIHGKRKGEIEIEMTMDEDDDSNDEEFHSPHGLSPRTYDQPRNTLTSANHNSFPMNFNFQAHP